MAKKKATGTASMLEREGLYGQGETPTDGPGNDLPEAPLYRLECPNKRYIGASGFQGKVVVFQGGVGRTDDRDLAWRLRQDYGYQVIPEYPHGVAS